MPKPIVPAVPRSRDALVSVCTKCDGDGKALRRALKVALEERGVKKGTRVVGTSCLDVCPKRAIAVAISDRRGEPGTRYYAVADTRAGCDAIVELIVTPASVRQ